MLNKQVGQVQKMAPNGRFGVCIGGLLRSIRAVNLAPIAEAELMDGLDCEEGTTSQSHAIVSESNTDATPQACPQERNSGERKTWMDAAAEVDEDKSEGLMLQVAQEESEEIAHTDVDPDKSETIMLQVALDESEESAFEHSLEASELATMGRRVLDRRLCAQVSVEAEWGPMVVRARSSPPAPTAYDDRPQTPQSLVSSLSASSLPTSSLGGPIYPVQAIFYTSLAGLISDDGHLPSVGTVDHGTLLGLNASFVCSCFPCKAFARYGGCTKGRQCLRCHGPHEDALVPRGGGCARQRASRLKASLRRVRTLDPFE